MKDTQLPSMKLDEFNNKTYRNPRNSGPWISAFSFKPNRSIQHGNVNLRDLLFPSPKESSIDDVAKSYEPLEEDYGRERIKRHRKEVAGKVQIPEKWDHEELLRDWMDHYSFDASLAPKGISSAREALATEGRRTRSTVPGIEDREKVLSI